MNSILFYTFLGIFVVTAILTLLSLPNWIKIPGTYKKVLFTSLIIEVIGCVILLFRQEMQFDYRILPDKNWVAMSTHDGQIIQPTISFGDSVVALNKPMGEVQNELLDNRFAIVNRNNAFGLLDVNKEYTLGELDLESMKDASLFNSLKAWQNEIPTSENYKIIKYFYDEDTHFWKQKGKYPEACSLKIEIFSDPEIGYRIVNINSEKIEFNSIDESKNVINLDQRKLHFLEIDHLFYLIRITQADLNNRKGKNYIHFMLVKLQPQLIP